jgi:hypothetical protein
MSNVTNVFSTSWRTRLVVSKSAKELQRALTKWYLGLVWGWEANGVAPERALSPPFHLIAQSTTELFKPIRKLASPRSADYEDRDEKNGAGLRHTREVSSDLELTGL